ncbi:hypothetical protein OIU85_016105 [Salix viminalis]|uniref:Uncharacterized protein n=1 Tax=Salix viminalis TaxID=40686 RepID=A0A9Q0V6D1_SALVM|nr:hypothetical protein OIU85_016105 [Salix viminalis]
MPRGGSRGISLVEVATPLMIARRCDPNREKNRQRLADCAIGFGKNVIGGRDAYTRCCSLSQEGCLPQRPEGEQPTDCVVGHLTC